MRNITEELEDIYLPTKAIVINVCKADENKVYVEAYDFDHEGKPVNAHPLSTKEMQQLSQSLNASEDLRRDYLDSRTLIPANILYKDNKNAGMMVWYTCPMKVNLLFKPTLKIPSGKCYVPALIWKADADDLWLYAMNTKSRPGPSTQLFKAPFFNVHTDGKVCMGNVDIDFENVNTTGEFMKQWEDYFWNSYFSHLLGDTSPVRGNIVSLWQHQIATGAKFPVDELVPIKLTINDLLK